MMKFYCHFPCSYWIVFYTAKISAWETPHKLKTETKCRNSLNVPSDPPPPPRLARTINSTNSPSSPSNRRIEIRSKIWRGQIALLIKQYYSGTISVIMGDDKREPLVDQNSRFKRCISHPQDELQSFRKYLKWLCVDQSNVWTACLSWSVFVVFALVVPAASHFVLACDTCDAKHGRPYDTVVQVSLSSVATLSFVCLSRFVRKYGLRRFLFFDKLWHESETVRKGYTGQLNVRSLFPLFCCLNLRDASTSFFFFLQ